MKHKTSPYIGQEFFPSDLTDFDCRGELIEDLDDEDLLDIISKYGKDVVAIEWSTRGYSQGDYIKGIAYVTKEKYDNEVCNKEGDWKEDCAKIIDNLDLDAGDATWLHQSCCCDHCVNHWGIDLCDCGSEHKVGECECGSQKAHDTLGIKYDSFGAILKNFG